MKLQKFFKLAIFACALTVFGAACVKEGPPGQDGANGATGAAGANGKDANETCKMCHTPANVDLIAVQFQYSKHEYGETALEESGNAGCSPCHTQGGFQDVVKRNVPATFTLNTTTGKYANDYNCNAAIAYGELLCRTCHSSIHETYTSTDLPKLTTTAPVALTFLGGKKSVNLTQDNGSSNLCIKCHQPRPFSFNNTKNAAYTGDVLDYATLASKPTDVFFDGTSAATIAQAKIVPGYRTHTHYGTVGAIVSGTCGIEFTGTMGYAQAAHVTKAACSDCHMAAMNGGSGGHSFNAKGNFNGCNVSGCHTGVNASSAKYWTNPRTAIQTLLNQLAAKLKYNGVEFLNRNTDSSSNLWYGLTANNYDGYLNVYDPATNPNGPTMNPAVFQNPSPAASWTADQKAYNLTLPVMKMTNAQFGAIINFQLCLREYSLGIHNLDYSKALLTNSLAIIP
ncbi:MAG: hypothetical protein LWW85_08655 [Marinilabiliales bacterium]|nr:hypothetical protein [Marinilabiliales bacterium]